MAEKPDFDKLVQNVVNASHEEGRHEAFGTEPMQPLYDRTHAAVNALLDAIAKLERACGVTEVRRG